MSRASENFMERVKEGQCPICFKEITNESKLIDDPTFGVVPICSHHAVHIVDRKVEVKTWD